MNQHETWCNALRPKNAQYQYTGCDCGFEDGPTQPPTDPVRELLLGQKSDDGKPPLDLIDTLFLEDIARVLGKGAQKYDLNQWQRGMALGKAMAGVLRHCFAVLRGEYNDPEMGTPHVAHAAAGLMFIHYFIRNNKLVPDDRFKK